VRAEKEFKRDREDEIYPNVQPEVRPHREDHNALSVAKGLVTEPVLTIEIGGREFVFMVDTGAIVSLIQPGISEAQVRSCDVQARGVTGTQLNRK
jgi:predicted aspartyl protease